LSDSVQPEERRFTQYPHQPIASALSVLAHRAFFWRGCYWSKDFRLPSLKNLPILGQRGVASSWCNLAWKHCIKLVEYAEGELPGMLVHRKVILESLLQGLPQKCLQGNAELISITQTVNSVIAHFKNGTDD
jgi:hypothetical protein